MNSQTKLGENIKKIRLEAKLTQKQVADKADMNVNYFARIERGEENLTFEVLEKIVKALKVKSSEIMPF
jgi:transcriptional regulator with XRE-family HTH domain